MICVENLPSLLQIWPVILILCTSYMLLWTILPRPGANPIILKIIKILVKLFLCNNLNRFEKRIILICVTNALAINANLQKNC